MEAAVVTEFGVPLEIQDVPTPDPGPDEVLVRIETGGRCHTDIHAAHDDWPVKPKPPFIPGHEGIACIERVGAAVTSRSVGDRVAYASLRRGGRLVRVALPADGTMAVPIFDTVLNGKSIIGSIVGTRNDLNDVFALHAAGRTRVVAVDRKLDEVNQSMDDVLAGDIPARVVFQL